MRSIHSIIAGFVTEAFTPKPAQHRYMDARVEIGNGHCGGDFGDLVICCFLPTVLFVVPSFSISWKILIYVIVLSQRLLKCALNASRYHPSALLCIWMQHVSIVQDHMSAGD